MQQLFDECSTLKREADTTFAAVCTMYGALCVVIDMFVTLIITTSLCPLQSSGMHTIRLTPSTITVVGFSKIQITLTR